MPFFTGKPSEHPRSRYRLLRIHPGKAEIAWFHVWRKPSADRFHTVMASGKYFVAGIGVLIIAGVVFGQGFNDQGAGVGSGKKLDRQAAPQPSV